MPRAKPRQSLSTTSPELLPDQVVEEQPTLAARLSVLNRAQLQALVETLAARQPNLLELIEDQLTLGGVAAAPSSSAKRPATRARRATAAAVTAIRRQMRSLLRSCDYLGEATYGVLELAEEARPHIEAGDGNGALAILEAVTDEFVTGWTDLDDSDGDAEGLFDDLSALWAESILTADLTPAERQTWAERLADWHNEAAEYGIDDGVRSRSSCRGARVGRSRAAADAAWGGWLRPRARQPGPSPVSPVRNSTSWSVRDASKRPCTWPTPRGRSIGMCRCWCG